MSATALFFAACLIQTQQTQPDAEAGKARLEAALKATELNFSKSTSGISFRLEFTSEAKNRIVFAANEPYGILSSQIHAVYTTVWTSKEKPSDALMLKVATMARKLGGFYGFKDAQGSYAIRFGVHYDISDLPANPNKDMASIKRLKDMIYFVNQVGQEAEKELAGQT